MKEHTQDTEQKPHVPKTAIGYLAVASSMFVPIIVNDKGERWDGPANEAPTGFKWNYKFEPRKDVKQPPSFDELLVLVMDAVMELREFIQYHEDVKKLLQETQAAFSYIEALVLGGADNGKLQPAKTTEEIVRLLGDRAKMRDVLEKAAASTPEQALKTVTAWKTTYGTEPTHVSEAKIQQAGQN